MVVRQAGMLSIFKMRRRKALTVSGDAIYTFDNVFDKWFGFHAASEVKAHRNLEWLTGLRKTQLYSIIWFNDILSITDAEYMAKTAEGLTK